MCIYVNLHYKIADELLTYLWPSMPAINSICWDGSLQLKIRFKIVLACSPLINIISLLSHKNFKCLIMLRVLSALHTKANWLNAVWFVDFVWKWSGHFWQMSSYRMRQTNDLSQNVIPYFVRAKSKRFVSREQIIKITNKHAKKYTRTIRAFRMIGEQRTSIQRVFWFPQRSVDVTV